MRIHDCCSHCARSLNDGVHEVRVSAIDRPDDLRTLRLCHGCATRPDRTWRRRFRTIGHRP